MKRPHDGATSGWPGETKRPAVTADYPPNTAKYALCYIVQQCFLNKFNISIVH